MNGIDTSASFYNDKHKNNSLKPITWNEGRLTSLRRCAQHAARERHSSQGDCKGVGSSNRTEVPRVVSTQ